MGLNLSGTIFEGDFASFDEISDVYDSVMALICVLSAGLAAGLTMGLLSLDNTKLEIKAMIGTDEDRAYASALLPLIKKHHLLLVTLMLSNSLANEALPIFLGSLVPNYLAILVSVVLVLICGEIVPSALFTGPRQLQMSARLANVVWFLLALFYPIAYPLSRVLDYFFGAEEADSTVSRVELEALMTLQSEGYTPQHRGSRIEVFPHRTPASGSFGPTSPLLHSAECGGNNRKKRESLLSIREVSIMTGILKLSKLTISSVLIAISDVYMIPFDLILDEDNIADILVSGFSRIPVYKRSREIIAGFLLVKTLAVVPY